MQSDREDEHTDIASHVTPGLALSAGDQPFYLSVDAVNYAALDHLVHFTSKASVCKVSSLCANSCVIVLVVGQS